jgi:hypothetical protein
VNAVKRSEASSRRCSAAARNVERPSLAEARRVADAVRALDLVDVDHLGRLRDRHAEDDRLPALLGEVEERRPRGRRQVALERRAQPERAGPRSHPVGAGPVVLEVAAVHERAQERQQAALGDAEAPAEGGQREAVAAVGEDLEDVERATGAAVHGPVAPGAPRSRRRP